MDKSSSRAAYFTQDEQSIIVNKYEEFKHIIQEKSNTVVATKNRKASWQKIADFVNASGSPSSAKRSWEQVRNKHKNIVQTINRKKSYAKRRRGSQEGPQAEESEETEESEEEPAFSNHPGLEGGVESNPGTASRQGPFVQVVGGALTLLPLSADRPWTQTKEELEEQDCSERALIQVEEPSLPPPDPVEPVNPSSRPRGPQEVGEDVRFLYRRSLQLDIEYKEQKIKKVKLEVEKLEYEKKMRENVIKDPK